MYHYFVKFACLSCLQKLRVGGHQYRLHNGMPVLAQPGGISTIKPTDYDKVPVVPACSLLVRIMPHTEVG